MTHLVEEIERTLSALRALHQAFVDGADLARLAEPSRAALAERLERLIIARVEVLNAFEILTRIDPERAKLMLLRCYLGRGVCPDTKFGGYEFELDTMVDDLVEIAGEGALAELVGSPGFDPQKLDDPRVRRCFAQALSREPEEVLEWYRDHAKHP